MPPVINKKKCIGCMTCVNNCPNDVFGLQKPGVKVPEVQYPKECKLCNACVLDCPVKAVSLRFPVPQMMVYYDPADRGKGNQLNDEA